MRIVFSNEKMFALDGIYNNENDGIWAVNREKVNRGGGKKQQGKFAEKDSMISHMLRERCTPCSV